MKKTKTHEPTSLLQAACITQQSCTLAVTHGTPIQLEGLTEDNGLLNTVASGATQTGQQHRRV